MGFVSRLKNGLKILQSNPPYHPPQRENRSFRINEAKTMFETMGLSQPVWGVELNTVGAYSREGYTSKTFDTPAIPFRQQAKTLQVDEDVQLAINHLSAKVTGGQHYIKGATDEIIEYFEDFAEDMRFDTFDTEMVKELLWYGNSIYKPRMGISNVKSFDDLMHIPISSLQRIWWDRQRIPYKYEFRGTEYQGYHNPGEIIHFKWNPIDASAFGTGFGVTLTAPRFFEEEIGDGTVKERSLASPVDRKYATQRRMQKLESRYISRNIYLAEGDVEERQELQSQVSNLDDGEDFVAGSKLDVKELGTAQRNFNAEQFSDITTGPILKGLNDFRGKQGSSESHQYANAETSAVLDEIGLSAFPPAVMEQLNEFLFKPWYESNPLPDPMTGGITIIPWKETGFEINFGQIEKKDIPIEDMIKLIDLFVKSGYATDPNTVYDLFEKAGLPITKEHRVSMDNMLNDPTGMMAMQGAGIPQDTSLYPYADIGGGPVIPNAQPMGFPNFNNQNMGSPPMDNPTYDSMARDVRGTQQGPFMPNRADPQPSNKSQDWDIGKYE